jgi:hypothetical protein
MSANQFPPVSEVLTTSGGTSGSRKRVREAPEVETMKSEGHASAT